MDKIFFISKIRLPESRGMSHGITNTCRGLAENGVSVELVLPDRIQTEEQYKDVDIWNYYGIKKDLFKIKRLKVVEIPIKHLHAPILGLSFSLHALVYLLKQKAKTIYLFTECKELLALLSFASKPFVVYESHILAKSKYEIIWERLGLSRINLLVTPTRYFANFYIKHGLEERRVAQELNGINLEGFDFKKSKSALQKELGLPSKKYIVGYAGKFTTAGMEKGVPELLEAVSFLKTKIPNIFAICVGGPKDYVEKYLKQAKKLGISNRVIILDHVNPLEFYKYVRSFDVCVMAFPWTHHFAYEMSPLKMLEYMASGNPLVASDLPSVKEILVDKKNCLLVKPGNAKDLSEKILYLYKNPQLGKKLTSDAKNYALSQTWKYRQGKILNKIKLLQI